MSRERGALAIVLHTHMPYVEGFGTWPFGEEWLWEAFTTSYLPLLDLLERDAPLTLSLTPVLCDQLEGEGVPARYGTFLDEVRRYTHHEDAAGLRAGGHGQLAEEVLRSWGDYEHALARLGELSDDLLGALAPYAQWTSAATHAVLPLLATDAGARAQIQGGVDAHRARVAGDWRGGFWLPECAYTPYLEPLLEDAGARAVCLELTDRFGLGAREHLSPILGESGVVLVPIDRATMAHVWSAQGYPADGGYRDYHRHTIHHHNPWANDGSAYDHAWALEIARRHAADFVARVKARLARDGRGLAGGGLVVCALDTELLGHWWYEGVAFIEAVLEECARQELELERLDDVLERIEPVAAGDVVGEAETISWGEGRDLSTWSGPLVAELAFAARAAELELVHRAPAVSPAALRQLLALQSSDWAFMISRGSAIPYARERFDAHARGLERALAHGPRSGDGQLRNLAVHADPALLQAR